MLARVILDVPALHCDGCIASVGQVLEVLGGIHEISGDLGKRQIIVEYDLATITPQTMSAQLEAIGYPVTGSHGR